MTESIYHILGTLAQIKEAIKKPQDEKSALETISPIVISTLMVISF